MSQEPKNKEEGFMYKFASFIVDKRNLIFLIVAIGLVFSVFSRSWVQVENQLSAYLPKESETYKGLHLMEDEFTTFGTAKLMLVNVSYDEAQAVSEQIADIDGVQSVSFDDTRDHYTNVSALYDITFDYSEDDDRCETVMNDIESALDGYDMYVSATFGDTASKTLAQEIGVIVIIVAIVVVSVLVLTSQTYAEVPVLLLTFIAAAVLNMGSNFLLGTISFVSNSVTIVLQLALSVDYAIILCNRYKEEHEKLPIREAVVVALSKAVPEICGSSLTTIGGLVAMLFMEFRLGFDLGICLIKSIFFSLFAVFFLMPGLLMLFGKKIDATRHKNFVPKIPFVGRFAYATKKIIPPIFLAVIIVAMLFANNCPYVYGFSYLKTTKQSAQQIADNMIDTTFGSSNMVAVVVPAGDYTSEKKLLDELGTYDEVDSTLGLSNVEAMGGYMLTDALTPRQFSELTDLDYEVAELLYAAYAADGGNYGKIIGGGMPVGAYAGSRALMEQVAPTGPVYQAGTLSGNPVAMAAGLAQLNIITDHPEIYTVMETSASYIANHLRASAEKHGIAMQVNQIGSLLCPYFTETPVNCYAAAKKSDTKRYAAYFNGMLKRGIYLAPSQFEAMFVSSVHTQNDLACTVQAAEETLSEMA